MAELAINQADSAQVRSLAEEILAAQGPEIETMTSWLSAWEVPGMATGETGQMDHGGMQMEGMSEQEAITELAGLSGAALDTQEADVSQMQDMLGRPEGRTDTLFTPA